MNEFMFLVFSVTMIVLTGFLVIGVVAIVSFNVEIRIKAIESLSSLSKSALDKIKK